jgi:hypothetical protein
VKPKTRCKFCNLKGHTVDFCPSTPTVPKPAARVPWADALLDGAPHISTSIFEGLPRKERLALFKAEGERLNAGNPWAGSTLRKNRLRAKIGFWAALGCPKALLSHIVYGLHMPFQKEPDSFSFPNNPDLSQHHDFVMAEINDGLESGNLDIVSPEFAAVINPIHVVLNSVGKKRKIVDARWPNSFLAYTAFKNETLGGLSRTYSSREIS